MRTFFEPTAGSAQFAPYLTGITWYKPIFYTVKPNPFIVYYGYVMP